MHRGNKAKVQGGMLKQQCLMAQGTIAKTIEVFQASEHADHGKSQLLYPSDLSEISGRPFTTQSICPSSTLCCVVPKLKG